MVSKNESQTGEVFVKIGPHGNMSGYEWDDGCFDGVREIFIWHDSTPRSLQLVYESAGRPVLSDRHGAKDGVNFFDTVRHLNKSHPLFFVLIMSRVLLCD
ncbi:unnamed protein product [Musa textilis]